MTPATIYRGSIIKNGWGLGKAQTGTYQLAIKVRVAEVAKDEDDLAAGFKPLEKPLTKTVFLPITGGTKNFVLADLQHIGYDRKTLVSAALIPGSPASFDFSDRPVVVQCVHDEWNGKEREKWKICRRKEAAAFAREDATQFDSLFGSDEEGTDSADVPI